MEKIVKFDFWKNLQEDSIVKNIEEAWPLGAPLTQNPDLYSPWLKMRTGVIWSQNLKKQGFYGLEVISWGLPNTLGGP